MVKSVKGKVGSTLKKLSKKADWIGAIAGYLGTIQTANVAYGSGEFLPNFINLHVNAVTRHNVGEITSRFPEGGYIGDPNWNSLFITGVGMAVGGKLLGYLPSVIPSQATIGSIVSKGGFGMAVGSFAAMIMGALAYGSGPFDNTGAGGSKNSKQPQATTSGRIPMAIKYRVKIPGGERTSWERPHG